MSAVLTHPVTALPPEGAVSFASLTRRCGCPEDVALSGTEAQRAKLFADLKRTRCNRCEDEYQEEMQARHPFFGVQS